MRPGPKLALESLVFRVAQIKLGFYCSLPHTVSIRQMFVVGHFNLPASHFPHLHLLLDLQCVNMSKYIRTLPA